MAHAYVHIGTEKTGTTSIQKFLKRNVKLLATHGANFPLHFTYPHHYDLVVPFTEEYSDIHAEIEIRTQADIDALLLDLDKRLSGARGTWVFSAEHFSSRLDTAEKAGNFLTWLGKYFDEITVVLFARRQDFWIPSSYSTTVLAGGKKLFDAEYTQRGIFNLESVVNSWGMHVKPENFIVCPYFENTADLKLIDEFLMTLNLPVDAPWKNPRPRVNKRMSADALEVLRLINRQVGPEPEEKQPLGWQAMRNYLREMPGTAWQLPAGANEAIVDSYRESNQRMLDNLAEISSPHFYDATSWQQWFDQPFSNKEPPLPPTPEAIADIMLDTGRHGFFTRGSLDLRAKVPVSKRGYRRGKQELRRIQHKLKGS